MSLDSLKLNGDGYWYLATPYTKYDYGLDIACSHAANVAGYLLNRDIHVFCPIAHTHPIAVHGGINPRNHKVFLPFDEQFMRHAHGLIVVKMPGWDESKGVEWEIEYFERNRRPIKYLEWPVLELENVNALYY